LSLLYLETAPRESRTIFAKFPKMHQIALNTLKLFEKSRDGAKRGSAKSLKFR